MTTVQFAVMVLGFAGQIAGLAMLGLLVYRQGRELVALRERVSPGEAAIYLEMRRVLERGTTP